MVREPAWPAAAGTVCCLSASPLYVCAAASCVGGPAGTSRACTVGARHALDRQSPIMHMSRTPVQTKLFKSIAPSMVNDAVKEAARTPRGWGARQAMMKARRSSKGPQAPKLPEVQVYSSFKELKKPDVMESVTHPLHIGMQYLTKKGSFAPLDTDFWPSDEEMLGTLQSTLYTQGRPTLELPQEDHPIAMRDVSLTQRPKDPWLARAKYLRTVKPENQARVIPGSIAHLVNNAGLPDLPTTFSHIGSKLSMQDYLNMTVTDVRHESLEDATLVEVAINKMADDTRDGSIFSDENCVRRSLHIPKVQ
eukprot:COSAG02_NODE_129_length_34796_cov_26.576015_20_plen_307_part_00